MFNDIDDGGRPPMLNEKHCVQRCSEREAPCGTHRIQGTGERGKMQTIYLTIIVADEHERARCQTANLLVGVPLEGQKDIAIQTINTMCNRK